MRFLASSVKTLRDITPCALRRPILRAHWEIRATNVPYLLSRSFNSQPRGESFDMATKEGKSNKLSFQLKTPKGTRDCELPLYQLHLLIADFVQ